jgi:hypothetical protein
LDFTKPLSELTSVIKSFANVSFICAPLFL